MKLSLSWIFSHLKKVDFQSEYEKGDFFDRLGSSVAEVEHVEKIIYPVDRLFVAKLDKKSTDFTFSIPENSDEVTLPARKDMVQGQSCLLSKTKDTYQYVTLRDMHADKDGLFPVVWVPEAHVKGAWKEKLPATDYILTFDNKALTHRPDLWGHRGFAREIAALYQLELVPEDHIFAQKPIRSFSDSTPAVAGNRIGLANHAPKGCKRLAGITLEKIHNTGCLPLVAIRLAAIDAKPMSLLIDMTNYVMYDIGQPMHAFDVTQLKGSALQVAYAQNGQQLTLLDGTSITLTPEDMVVTDGTTVLGLAGIMGGKNSGVTPQTTAVVIEAACYVPEVIRRSSQRHKLRTEASARFEKSLDPLANTQALLRFLHLLDVHDITYESAQAIISIGNLPEPIKITFTGAFIAQKIGMAVSADTISATLTGLGFGVQQKHSGQAAEFTVTVPSFRATKDVTIAEDVVEEIARFIGFQKLSMQLPQRSMKPFSVELIHKKRALKRLCAFGLQMHEVSNYALYDNEFLARIGLDITPERTLANPVSEHWTKLVTSLIPHLLKNVEQNVAEHDAMAFFELNTVWSHKGTEKQVCSGIWYHQEPLDFYQYKEKVQQLFALFHLAIIWRKPVHALDAWYHPYQTAELVYNNHVIGYAGIMRPDIVRTCATGHAFIFEIDLEILMSAQAEYTYTPTSTYQPITTDVSLAVAYTVSVDSLEQAIAHSDARIYEIQVVDYLEKPEWREQRAVTLRYKAVDQEKTFSKQEIDELRAQVNKALQKCGATIR